MIKEKRIIHSLLFTCGLALILPQIAWCNNTGPTSTIPAATPSLELFKNSTNPTANPATPNNHAPIARITVTVPPPPVLPVKAYVLIDAPTGKVLAAYNPNLRLEPASLTKMMTSAVISEAIKEGKIHLTDLVPVSEKAWRTGGSKMFIKVGSQVPVKDLMQGIIVDSGNDACVAMAEFVAGTEDAFANLMNQVAQMLGMQNSYFVDSTGLPNPQHYSSAYDLSLLARHLVYDYPEDYSWYSQKWFTYNGIRQPNRNRLLWRDPTADGIKTGHTDGAGFCLVASAKRNGIRLISVVLGAPSDSARAEDSQRLLDYGFRFFETHTIYPANTALAKVRVWNGDSKNVNAGIVNPFIVSLIPGQFSSVTYHVNVVTELQAPVKKGDVLGEIQALVNNKVIEKAPVVALQDDAVGGFWRRLFDQIARWFHHGHK